MCAVPDLLDSSASLAGRNVLVVGCRRPELLAAALGRGAAVWGVDDSADRLGDARGRVPGADLRLGRPEELPFDSGTFDVVCAPDGIGPATDGEAALTELVRVCRRRGVVVIHRGEERPGRIRPGSPY